MRIAYYYEFDYASGVNPHIAAGKVIAYINDWKENPEPGSLFMLENEDDSLVLYDTRTDAAVGELRLEKFERAVYQFCDEVRSPANVLKFLRETFPAETFSESGLRQFLDSMTENRLMITDGENFLSLAINAQPLVKTETKFETDYLEHRQKPLSSYLPKELPVLNFVQQR